MNDNLKNIEEFCDLKVLILNKFLIIRTTSYNKFLIFSEKAYIGKIVTIKSKDNIIIKGTQILEVYEEAIFYLDYMEIKFFGKPEKIETYFSIFENFNFNFYDIIKDHSYVPIVHVDKVLKNEEFNNLGKNLIPLKKELTDMDNSVFYNNFHYIWIGLLLESLNRVNLFCSGRNK